MSNFFRTSLKPYHWLPYLSDQDIEALAKAIDEVLEERGFHTLVETTVPRNIVSSIRLSVLEEEKTDIDKFLDEVLQNLPSSSADYLKQMILEWVATDLEKDLQDHLSAQPRSNKFPTPEQWMRLKVEYLRRIVELSQVLKEYRANVGLFPPN